MPLAFLTIGLLLLTGSLINYKMKKAGKQSRQSIQQYLHGESFRYYEKKEIPDELFIKIDGQNFPFKEYDENAIPVSEQKIYKKQKVVKRKLALPMMKFDKSVTATALKKSYGNANLDRLISYEEHYNSFLRGVYEWAQALYDAGDKENAKTCLEQILYLRPDISKVYRLLADLYFETKDQQSLLQIKDILSVEDFLLKDAAVDYIEKLLTKM